MPPIHVVVFKICYQRKLFANIVTPFPLEVCGDPQMLGRLTFTTYPRAEFMVNSKGLQALGTSHVNQIN